MQTYKGANHSNMQRQKTMVKYANIQRQKMQTYRAAKSQNSKAQTYKGAKYANMQKICEYVTNMQNTHTCKGAK